MNKYFYTSLCLSMITLSSTFVNAQETDNPNNSKTVFVCSEESENPTMFAYTLGQTTIKPVIVWYQEYLLPEQSGIEVCQQVVGKLQSLSQQQQKTYFVSQRQESQTLICLVNQEDHNCSSETSEPLFSINPHYDASCILDQREPIECMAVGKVRGVFSIENEPYRPLWWLW